MRKEEERKGAEKNGLKKSQTVAKGLMEINAIMKEAIQKRAVSEEKRMDRWK